MKEQLNINALFQKAASAPATSSFGETKELFLSTVGVTKVSFESNKTQVLTLKNGLIMLAIVSTIIASVLLIPSKEIKNEIPNKETIVTPV